MAGKRKASKTSEKKVLPSIASMKFWSLLKNPGPSIPFVFPDLVDDDEEVDDDVVDQLSGLTSAPVPDADSTDYSLKITLQGSNPLVWRRVLTKSLSLEALHDAIQLTMGWENAHLHSFSVCGLDVPAVDDRAEIDEGDISIGHLVGSNIDHLYYTYDFGDNWLHLIEIEKTLSANPSDIYPCCTEGRGACPHEDSGGIERWTQILSLLKRPGTKLTLEEKDSLERIGIGYVPVPFDAERANELLKRAFQRKKGNTKSSWYVEPIEKPEN